MPEDNPPGILAKTCGDCGLCCKLMGVSELEKPAGKWCRQFSRSTGCRTYETRPGDCRIFNCLWLLTEALDETWKPTTAGFVLHSEQGGARLVVECDAARPHEWRREPYQGTLRRWAAAPGQEVLVFVGSRGLRLGEPDTPVRRV